MNFFFGFLTCYLFTFFLGSLFSNFKFKTITEKFISSILISLWLSWILVIFIKIYSLNFNFYILFFVTASILIFNYFKKKEYLDLNSCFYFFTYFFIFFLIFILIIIKDYLPVFVHGDAVFSFNFWSWKLYSNTFENFENVGYPIFWPGLWSLIYKGIGSFKNWIIPNISLMIIPITAILSIYSYFEKGYLKIFLLNIFFLFFLFFILSNRFLIGYMDIPVTLMTYISLSLLFVFYIDNDKKYFYLASIAVAIASVTKQQSFILPFLFLIVTFYNYFIKKISFRDLLLGNLIAYSHLLLFIFIFEDTNIIDIVINIFTEKYGNMSYLGDYSSQHIKNNTFIYGLEVLSKRITLFVILLFLTFSLINFYKPSANRLSLFGLMSLSFFLIGFYFFSKYGAYDERNGWFTLPYLFFGFLCGINNVLKLSDKKTDNSFPKIINKNFKINYGLIINSVFIILLSLSLIFQSIFDFNYVQKKIQSSFGGTKEIAQVASNFLKNNKNCSKLITNLNILPYNYYLLPYYLNLDLEKNYENRIILLHSETTLDIFENQNKECSKKDIWVLTRPFQSQNLKISYLNNYYEKNIELSENLKRLDSLIYIYKK